MSRLSRVAGWATGAPLATFRFLARSLPLHEHDGALDGFDAGEQGGDGLHGQPVRRLLRARVRRPRIEPEQLIDIIATDPNVVMPIEVARFTRTDVSSHDLAPGDELLIRMAGPWDGPVRVVNRAPDRIRFESRAGNVQAGEFEFRARRGDGGLVFEVESRAQSASRWFDLLYRRLSLAERMQVHTWAHVVEAAAQVAGGRVPGGIEAYSSVGGTPRERVTVVYDPDSSVCRALTALAIRTDRRRRIWPAAMQSEEGAALLRERSAAKGPLWIDRRGTRPATARVAERAVRALPRRVLTARMPRYLAEWADGVIAARRAAVEDLDGAPERATDAPG